MLQHEIVWRPPAYYTCDWAAARRSVETIAALDPEVLATGHGHPMRGALMRLELRNLVEDFDYVMPMSGRYIPFPAVTDHSGAGISSVQIAVQRGSSGLYWDTGDSMFDLGSQTFFNADNTTWTFVVNSDTHG